MDIKYNKNLVKIARKLRNEATTSEKLLWNEIKGKKLGYQFNRQQSVGNYIVDFLCRKEKAVVEIDGVSHDGKADYDKKRDEFLKSQNLIVIHIHDFEVKQNLDSVLAFIKKCIKTRTSTEIVTRY